MANTTPPESFSLYLLPGEALVCGALRTTPHAPYLVTCALEDMTPTVLQAWFLQSIQPLVGTDAADALKKLMEARNDLTTDFLNKVLTFRKGLTSGKA